MKKYTKLLALTTISAPLFSTIIACSSGSNTDVKLTVIDGDKLFSSIDLEFIGSNGNGVLKNTPPIEEGIEWIYFINDIRISNTPTNLSNGDVVSLWAGAKINYEVSGQTIKKYSVTSLSASTGPVEYDAQNILDERSVSFTGENMSGTLNILSPPPALRFGFVVNNGPESFDLPTNLSNFDFVSIYVRSNNLAPGDTLINDGYSKTLTVTGLVDPVIPGTIYDANELLDNAMISFTGENGYGSLSIADLPMGLRYKYKLNNNSFSTLKPSNLSNGDFITISIEDFTLGEDDSLINSTATKVFEILTLTVPGTIGTIYDANQLLNNAQVTLKGESGSGTFTITSLPTGLKYSYKVNNGNETFTIPTNLSNGDSLMIGIKDDDLPPDDSLVNGTSTKTINVSSLIIPGTIYDANQLLNNSQLSFSGESGSGTFTITSLPTGLKYGYKVNNGNETFTIPTNLSNGDSLMIGIKEDNLPPDDSLVNGSINKTVSVSGLSIPGTIYDANQLLNNAQVTLKGESGSGTFTITSLPTGLKYSYKVNNGNETFTIPTNLSNGDFLMIGIKDDNLPPDDSLVNGTSTKTINVSSLIIPGTIYDANQLLNNSQLSFSGESGSGTFTITSLPTGLKYGYKVNNGNETFTIPTNLSNGDSLMIGIKEDNLPPDDSLVNGSINKTVSVSGLSIPGTIYDANQLLNNAQVTLKGESGSGTFTITSLPTGLKYSYKVNNGNETFTIPTNLSNGDSLMIGIKEDNLPANDSIVNEHSSKTLNISGLTIPSVPGIVFDTEDIMNNITHSFSGEEGSGEFIISALPSNVQYKYKLNNGTYSTSKPTNLSNGDKIYVQLDIIDPSNGDSLDNDPTKLFTVSNLTPPSVAVPVIAPLDRNSTIVDNGASSYTVLLSSAVGIGSVFTTTQYETDMFVYEIADNLVLNGASVTKNDVEAYIRKVENNTQYGPGMYSNWFNNKFNDTGKTVIPVLALDNGLAVSTSHANSTGVEVIIGTGFNRDLDFFASTTIHELAHKDGMVTTGMMIEKFDSAYTPHRLHKKFKENMKNNPLLNKYTQYLDASKASSGDRVDIPSAISTPWGELPAGTSVWAPSQNEYIFYGNEMIARTVEIMGTNFPKDDYTQDVSQLYRTIGAMYEEFGDTMFDSEAASSAHADLLINDVYAYNHFGGHTKSLAHTNNTTEIAYVKFDMQFNTNYQPYEPEMIQALSNALSNGKDYATAGQPFGVYFETLKARPTSLRFNTDYSNNTFEKDYDGISWSVDDSNLDSKRQGMLDFFEGIMILTPSQLDFWEIEYYDKNHNVIGSWKSTSLN